ncbi:MAG: chorismate mutase [Selenomonadaceae bacterium]
MQGIRGAITVESNNKNEIFSAVQKMLMEILLCNEIGPEDIGAALFSATDDLTAVFPAAAARTLAGWDFVPLFDARQLEVDHSLQKCIRVLLLVNTDKQQREIRHVYLGKAVVLRPDLTNK